MIARLSVIAALALAALPGCGSDEDGSAARDAPELAGTSWMLDTGALGVAGADGVEAPLEFEQDGISGSDGCNRIFGPYEQAGTELKLGPLASTKMACDGPGGEVSAKVSPALAQVASFAIDGERLTLRDTAGAELLAYERAGAG